MSNFSIVFTLYCLSFSSHSKFHNRCSIHWRSESITGRIHWRSESITGRIHWRSESITGRIHWRSESITGHIHLRSESITGQLASQLVVMTKLPGSSQTVVLVLRMKVFANNILEHFAYNAHEDCPYVKNWLYTRTRNFLPWKTSGVSFGSP